MKGICVFWIPTIYHQTIKPLKDRHDIEEEDISDRVGYPCQLTLRLELADAIFVNLFFAEENKSLTFTLTRTEDHRNGFFAYHFEVEDASFEIVRMVLVNPIYHYVKGFYHKHQYHSIDCDSILNAYVLGNVEKVNVDCPDNKPLVFYLRQYENRFKDFAEQLEYDANYLSNLDKGSDFKDMLYREKYEEFNQKCINVLGEVIYYHTLLNSKHNYSYKLNLHEIQYHDCQSEMDCPSKEELSELYKSAINTENAITRIKLIAERVKSVYHSKRANATLINILMAKQNTEASLSLQQDVKKSLQSGERSSKLSVRLGYLGALLGVLSVALAFWPMINEYMHKEDSKPEPDKVENRDVEIIEEAHHPQYINFENDISR